MNITQWYNTYKINPRNVEAFGGATKVHGGTSMGTIISGIYVIENKTNGKIYVGSSANIQERWKRHIKLLSNGKHHSNHLQNAWNKYGENNFEFKIVVRCSCNDLICNEQKYIDLYKPEYNVSPTAGRTTGVIRSVEYIEKQRTSQKGKVLSDETRRKISEGMKGKKNSLGTKRTQTQKTIEKIRNSLLGHFVSKETRAKIGAKNKGRKHTEEACQRISNSLIGNKRAHK